MRYLLVALIAASALFGWALSKEIEAFTDVMEDYDA